MVLFEQHQLIIEMWKKKNSVPFNNLERKRILCRSLANGSYGRTSMFHRNERVSSLSRGSHWARKIHPAKALHIAWASSFGSQSPNLHAIDRFGQARYGPLLEKGDMGPWFILRMVCSKPSMNKSRRGTEFLFFSKGTGFFFFHISIDAKAFLFSGHPQVLFGFVQ